MDLLRAYDDLSLQNKLDILGVDFLYKIPRLKNITRVSTWIKTKDWFKIKLTYYLLLGVVKTDDMKECLFKINGEIVDGKLVNGYWRPSHTPFPLTIGTVEIKCEQPYELAFIYTPYINYDQEFEEFYV